MHGIHEGTARLDPNRNYNGLAIEFKHPGFEPSPTTEQLAFHSDCCERLFPSKKHVDTHILHKRKHDAQVSATLPCVCVCVCVYVCVCGYITSTSS